MKRISLIVLFLFITGLVIAAKVETIQVKSISMDKEVEVLVITPEKKGKYPVVYLLHGYGGNAQTWMGIKPELPEISEKEGIIIVCPDGKKSWYWDSPKNQDSRYETFVAKELVSYIDSKYPTISHRGARAITGFSMGGHGAMWLSMRNKEVYGAAGSMSGGLDIRPFPNNWDMAVQLGVKSQNRPVWDEHTVINQIDNLKNGDLALIIDCGYGDFFLEVNNDFHNELLKYKIMHEYVVRPGKHDGKYWNNAIDYQILFFKKFFDRQ